MMPNKLTGLLGLARRAGALSLGHDAAEGALLGGKAKLCILAEDASERLKEEMTRTAQRANTAIACTPYSKIELSKSIGTKPIAVFTVDDEGFASAIEKLTGRDGYHDEKI